MLISEGKFSLDVLQDLHNKLVEPKTLALCILQMYITYC
jgi:hypothetical protein